MRLAEFIRQNMEPILREWEAFAATLLPAATGLGSLALRDHAREILDAVAKDLDTPQTADEQSAKSKGLAPKVEGAPETAAQIHAVLRAGGGFDINQLVAEYRALRASILRLWIDAVPPEGRELQDMIRFNEAIDQAVAESVGHFHAKVEVARNLLLGMLGHDMRSPLATIVQTASHLARLNAGEVVSQAAARLVRSGQSMQALLNDLVDFNRTNLGLGIKVVPTEIDLSIPIADELEQLRGAYPDRRIELKVSGDCRGRWDGPRLQQSLRNLVTNAVQHGFTDSAVVVALIGSDDEVRIEVTNAGTAIEPAVSRVMFEPLSAAPSSADRAESGSLGLGLYIVREIAKAHGGDVDVTSLGGETKFVVRLPRVFGDGEVTGEAADSAPASGY